MPLIETEVGEALQVKRLGIEYFSIEGYCYYIDSEPVGSSDYDIAVYVDTLMDESSNSIVSNKKKNSILFRVGELSERINVRLKFFKDYGEVYVPKQSNLEIDKENEWFVFKKLELGKIIKSENVDGFNNFLNKNQEFIKTLSIGIKKESLLHFLAGKGKTKFCKLLLEKGFNVDIDGNNFETPLVRASENGNLEVAKVLIDFGANINGLPNSIATPLIAASATGHGDLVKLLLSKGADINIKDKEINLNALEIAKSLYQDDVVEILKSPKDYI